MLGVLVVWFGFSAVLCLTLATVARRLKRLRKAEIILITEAKGVAIWHVVPATQPHIVQCPA